MQPSAIAAILAREYSTGVTVPEAPVAIRRILEVSRQRHTPVTAQSTVADVLTLLGWSNLQPMASAVVKGLATRPPRRAPVLPTVPEAATNLLLAHATPDAVVIVEVATALMSQGGPEFAAQVLMQTATISAAWMDFLQLGLAVIQEANAVASGDVDVAWRNTGRLAACILALCTLSRQRATIS